MFGNEKINFTNFTVRDEVNDLFYQQLINANQGIRNYISGDFGAVLYSNSFYLGISSTQLISKNISGDPLLNEITSPQWNIQTSGNIEIGADLSLNPVLRITYSQHYNMQWATGARMRYKELIYIGGGFNSEKKLSLLFGVSLNDRLAINYAYDKHLSELNDFNSTMHEFMLSISLFRRYGIETKFW
jgi:type IX secretion system PorP/SprF family membrane protein